MNWVFLHITSYFIFISIYLFIHFFKYSHQSRLSIQQVQVTSYDVLTLQILVEEKTKQKSKTNIAVTKIIIRESFNIHRLDAVTGTGYLKKLEQICTSDLGSWWGSTNILDILSEEMVGIKQILQGAVEGGKTWKRLSINIFYRWHEKTVRRWCVWCIKPCSGHIFLKHCGIGHLKY